MKKKRVQYNEINEEVYQQKYWSKPRLIFMGMVLVILGFFINFPIEEKLNRALADALSSNQACPIQFDKAEFHYFLPKLVVKKATILGACFGQPNNTLTLHDVKIGLDWPSFYPVGLKFHIAINEKKTKINIYPILSLFSHYIDIKDTSIDPQIFAATSIDGKFPIMGIINVDGSFKLTSGSVEEGEFILNSRNFYLPAQNFRGFEMGLVRIDHVNITGHYNNKNQIKFDHIDLGKSGKPIDLKLKGTLDINHVFFMNSYLQLNGSLKLSNFIMTNFSFIKIFLPANNTTGNYQMKLQGNLTNLTPEFK